MSSPHPCRLFLFDLDGTLVDSREDIARAINNVLRKVGQPSLSLPDVLRFVGEGIEILIQRALRAASGREPDADEIRTCVTLMLQEYEEHLCDATHLYPGVRETLAGIDWARMGLITNKLESLSRRILKAFELDGYFSVVLGGDSLRQRKPDPAPLLEAMARCAVLPAETVMVGDSCTDILAGRAAGVFTCGVAGGFRGREELQAAGRDLIIDNFGDLLLHFCAPRN
jgi:phosphoglycolate phosphatase